MRIGKRKRHQKGFTLAELLIVVAIIGILVAISVPIFGKQLHKAKVAVDQANARAAKSAAVAAFIDSDVYTGTIYLYDASDGNIYSIATDHEIEPYGQTSSVEDGDDIDGADTGEDLTEEIVEVKITFDDAVYSDDGSTVVEELEDSITVDWTTTGTVSSD